MSRLAKHETKWVGLSELEACSLVPSPWWPHSLAWVGIYTRCLRLGGKLPFATSSLDFFY
jgi:hypothetical protein